ncbi:MAG: hypothetical protein QOD74_2536, partial [Variibacter sp.]|nr:hypothetical protein [Variibacter sp.]
MPSTPTAITENDTVQNETLEPPVKRLLEHVQDQLVCFGPKWATEYAALTNIGEPRRFFVSRLGGSGSTWFAKTLNSHPDVFCSHEGVLALVYPRRAYDDDDHFRFIERMARDNMHGSYRAIGDVGSTWLGQQIVFPKQWTTGWLVRHPVRTLNTVMQNVLAEGEGFPPVAETEWNPISLMFEVDCAKLSPGDLFLLHQAEVWARSLLYVKYFRAADHIIRIEDMSN